jgi:hypothetical protein
MLPGLLANRILSRKLRSVELSLPSMFLIWYSVWNVDSSKPMKLYRGPRYSQISYRWKCRQAGTRHYIARLTEEAKIHNGEEERCYSPTETHRD